jgi:hypothetical protein
MVWNFLARSQKPYQQSLPTYLSRNTTTQTSLYSPPFSWYRTLNLITAACRQVSLREQAPNTCFAIASLTFRFSADETSTNGFPVSRSITVVSIDLFAREPAIKHPFYIDGHTITITSPHEPLDLSQRPRTSSPFCLISELRLA